MAREQPSIGKHLATLNLFREADGTCQITVAAAPGAMDEYGRLSSHLQSLYARPIDYVETLILAAADEMKDRR